MGRNKLRLREKAHELARVVSETAEIRLLA